MVIASSTSLRNDYTKVSAAAHETGEPIFITKNGESDLVVMSHEAFEAREKMLNERAAVLEAEAGRIAGDRGFSTDACREMLAAKLGAYAV